MLRCVTKDTMNWKMLKIECYDNNVNNERMKDTIFSITTDRNIEVFASKEIRAI